MVVPISPKTYAQPGAPKVVRERFWNGLSFHHMTETIKSGVEWEIERDCHTVVVHLDGKMRRLESELAGAGSIKGAALPGEIWFIPGNHKYLTKAEGGNVEYATLLIDDRLLPKAKDTALPLQGHLGRFDPFLHQSTLRLCDAIEAEDGLSSLVADQVVRSICAHVSCGYRGDSERAERDHIHPVVTPKAKERLRDYIHAHLSETIRLKDLADVAGMSEHQLLIGFRAGFGTTPAQFVLEQRLRKVRFLLSHSAQTITDIAYLCGFSSHSHLTTAFRNQFGMTPSAFRVSTS